MGWRERDWAKFSDDEWARLVGSGRQNPLRTTATLGASPLAPAPAPARDGRSTVTAVTLVAAVVTVLATALGFLLHVRPTAHVRQPPLSAPANVLGVHWRPADVTPAPTAGEICVPTPTAGRVCARYAAGERPANALRAQLRAAGIAVR